MKSRAFALVAIAGVVAAWHAALSPAAPKSAESHESRLVVVTSVDRTALDHHTGTPALGALPVYSSGGEFAFGPPMDVLIADDITTTVADGCPLDRFVFHVTGDASGSDPTAGPFTVSYALYNICPEAGGVAIVDTSGTADLPGGGVHEIVVQIPAETNVPLPSSVYFGVSFSRDNAGILGGVSPLAGHSDDDYCVAGAGCDVDLGGFPDYPHASFGLELHVRGECAEQFPGYRNSNHGGPIFLSGTDQAFADELRLATDSCNMVGIKVGVRGRGLFDLELRNALGPVPGGRSGFGVNDIPGTYKPFLNVATEGTFLRSFTFDPPIALPETLWFVFVVNNAIAGPVLSCDPGSVGRSEDLVMLDQKGAWVPAVVGDDCHNAINVTIYCEGSEPLGACCDMAQTDDAGEAVCREVPWSNCNMPALWREGEICASACVGGANDGQPCTRAVDCGGGDCPGPFPMACGLSACCTSDGACTNLTSNECDALAPTPGDGLYRPGEFCEEGVEVCPLPACLAAAGACLEPHAGVCRGGTEDGTTCDVLVSCDASPCCQGGGTCERQPACGDGDCCSRVCRQPAFAYCCSDHWDEACAKEATRLCTPEGRQDECAGDLPERGARELSLPSRTTVVLNRTTTGPTDPGLCCLEGDVGGSADASAWFKFVAPPSISTDEPFSSVRLSTCGLTGSVDPAADDSLLSVFSPIDPDRGICGDGTMCSVIANDCADGSACVLDEIQACQSLATVACNDDAGSACSDSPTPQPGNSDVCAAGLVPGQTHYVMLSAKTSEDVGTYTLTATAYCTAQAHPSEPDCDADGTFDVCELPPYNPIGDCDANLVPDACDPDCNVNYIPDVCDVPPVGEGADCNANLIPDECEHDCNADGIPDECQMPPYEDGDCDGNVILDVCDLDEVVETEIVTAIEPEDEDNFGWLVDISGDLMLVLQPHFADFGLPEDALQVFRFVSDGWIGEAVLPLTDGDSMRTADENMAIALHNDLAVFAACNIFNGIDAYETRIFFYRRTTSGWREEGRVALADMYCDRGWLPLVTDGEYVFVGDPEFCDGKSDTSGAVHVFTQIDREWMKVSQLLPANPSGVLGFGAAIAVDQRRLLVEAVRLNQSSADDLLYVFEFMRVDGTWQPAGHVEMMAGAGVQLDVRRLSLSGDRFAIQMRGGVAVYHRTESVWRQESSFRTPYAHIPVLDGDDLIIGPAGWLMYLEYPYDDILGMPRFRYNDTLGAWEQLRAVVVDEADYIAGLGLGLDIAGDALVAGALRATEEFYHQGVVKVYDLAANDCDRNQVHDTCEGDFDADGVIDACDNCELFYNVTQHDCDSNGVGDLCDMIYCPLEDLTCSDCNYNAVLDRCEPEAAFVPLGAIMPDSLPSGSEFGTAVAMDGAWIVASAPREHTGERYSGALYFLRNTGSNWTQANRLVIEDDVDTLALGASVAIEGAIAVAGAPYNTILPAPLRIYVRHDSSWERRATFPLPVGERSFGWDFPAIRNVAVHGPMVIAGAYAVSEVLIFEERVGSWENTATLVSPASGDGGAFGVAVAADAGWLAVGAPILGTVDCPTCHQGAVYMYRLTGELWIRHGDPLTEIGTGAWGFFGAYVALDGDTLVVGAPYFRAGHGAAFVYRLGDQGWVKEAELANDDTQRFGTGVSVAGDFVLIGDRDGRVYPFEFVWDGWSSLDDSALGDVVGDTRGAGFDLQGGLGIVGSPIDPDLAEFGGAIEVIDIDRRCNDNGIPDECEVDEDGDRVADLCDNCPGAANLLQFDADADGFGDACDECTDTDGDGLGDPDYPSNTCAVDPCPRSADHGDADDDSILDGCDNCVGTANPKQADGDRDGVGDACDTCSGFDDAFDADSDGVPDGCDLCADFDDNLDDDGDTIPNACDNCTLANPQQGDCDYDGLGDVCEMALCAPGDIACADCNANTVPDGCEVNFLMQPIVLAGAIPGERFGTGIGMSGDILAVGAPLDRRGDYIGTVTIYNRVGADWVYGSTLISDYVYTSQGAINYGGAVAVGEDLIIVGASGENCTTSYCGNAHFYERTNDGMWEKTFSLDVFLETRKHAASAVATDGDSTLIGLPLNGGVGYEAGEVWPFEGLRRMGILRPGDLEPGDRFGSSVAVGGDVAVITAPGDNDGAAFGSGSIYVFRKNGGHWLEETRLTAPEADSSSGFGSFVATDGAWIIARAVAGTPAQSGVVYVFRYLNGTWTYTDKLSATDVEGSDRFGRALAITDGRIVVGADGDDDEGAGAGAAYVYEQTESGWKLLRKLRPTVLVSGDNFGSTLVAEGMSIVVGARNDNSGTGAAYAFDIQGADCHGDGLPDDCQVGDFDGLGGMDLLDYAGMTTCLTGPCVDGVCGDPVPFQDCCLLVDLDFDADIDLKDVAAFQRTMMSP